MSTRKIAGEGLPTLPPGRDDTPANRRAGKRANGKSASKLEKQPTAAEKAVMLALQEIAEPLQPRARLRLRAAMRKLGLDEWKIAWLLNFKIHCLANSQKSSDNKLLLDYLKEAARHLDPASGRAAAEPPAIEIVHGVPRPRDGETASN